MKTPKSALSDDNTICGIASHPPLCQCFRKVEGDNTPTNNEKKLYCSVPGCNCTKDSLPQTTTKDWEEAFIRKFFVYRLNDRSGTAPHVGAQHDVVDFISSLIESTKQEERKKVQVDERMRAVEILHKYFMTTTRKESLDVIEIAQKEIMSDLSE